MCVRWREEFWIIVTFFFLLLKIFADPNWDKLRPLSLETDLGLIKTGLAETREANRLVGGRELRGRVSMKLPSRHAWGGPAQLQRGSSAGMDSSPTLGANLLQIIIKRYHIFQRLLQVKKQKSRKEAVSRVVADIFNPSFRETQAGSLWAPSQQDLQSKLQARHENKLTSIKTNNSSCQQLHQLPDCSSASDEPLETNSVT